MKKLILLFALISIAEISTAQTTKTKPQEYKLTRDTTQLFYGLSPEKFLKLKPEEGRKLISKHSITATEFLRARIQAEGVIHEKQIIKDSLEILRIYDRIDRKLKPKSKNPE